MGHISTIDKRLSWIPNARDHLTYINYPSSPRVSFQYDQLNRLTNMVDAAGTSKFTYTSGNQLLTETPPWTTANLTNTYVNRLRTKLALQAGTKIWTNAFIYDAAGRLTNVASPAGVFSYTLGGGSPGSRLVKKLALPNTAYITNTFDAVARLSGTFLENSGNTVLDSATYGYDLAGERLTFTKADGNGNVTYLSDKNQAMAASYRYDPFGNTLSSSGAQARANIFRFSSKEQHANTR